MEKKKMPLPKKKPRHVSPKHRMNTERTKPLGKKEGGKMPVPISPRQMAKKKLKENYDLTSMFIRDDEALKKKQARQKTLLGKLFGSGPSKDIEGRRFAKKEAVNMLKKESPKLVKRLTKKASGGKLKMVEKGGKKVPFFAADGVGKMMGGGMMKKKMSYAKGGAVKVKSGDTLSQIAKSKGVTLKALMAANPSIRNANQIRVGQSIKMPDSRAGKGTPMSGNPYEGMTRSSMKALADDTAANRARLKGAKPPKARTAKSPDVAKKRATTTTRLNQLGEVNRRQRAAEASSPKVQKKASTKKTLANTPKSGAAKVAETRMARLANKNKTARRMGGGSMKKVQGYKSGGTVRGAGAATKGTGFNRAG